MAKAIGIRYGRATNGRVRFGKSVIASATLVGTLSPTGVAHAQGYTDFSANYVFHRSAPEEIRRTIRERTFAARPFMLEARGGLSTIVGLLGATASYDPWSRLCLGAGLGGNTSGIQLAAFARLRPLVFMGKRWARLHAVGLELGYSNGAFHEYTAPGAHGGSPSAYSYDFVHWLQPQITYETRSYRGFNLLAGVGAAIPLASYGYHCLDPSSCNSNHLGPLLTMTIGLGWSTGR